MDLYYLIYTSVPARPMKDTELYELLHISREANSRFDVTGMLICLPESFTQLIEGPKTHIDQLYRNIQLDKRHLRVTTLREGAIAQRFFPDWAMAFKKQKNSDVNEGVLNLHDQEVLQLFDILETN
jgi:hypothetical protein